MTTTVDQSPPPAPPPDPVYLLLIDSRVANYQDIINSKQPGVYHVVFHVPETATSSKDLFDAVHVQIAELGVPSFTSIGLVQHNDAKPRYEMFGKVFGRMKPLVRDVQAKDPYLETWKHVALFITMLHINYRIEYFDMMACALYSNPDWKYIIDELTKKTGVTVRASTDDTGAATLGGDWFLESHTGVNLKEFYFTEAIERFNGLLLTSSVSNEGETGAGADNNPAKKLILIDSRIKDIPTVINSMNDDTYCLVFNYFYDTPTTILSKLRFLTGENRYILDQFYYEEPVLPTRMDVSGNHCTPCDDFDMDSFQLLPATLQTEYMSYTMDGSENNGRGLWPFYSQSTEITIQKPVFFQRSKVGEESNGETDMTYKARPYVLVSDLDEIYELAQTAGEIAVGDSPVFGCVGIIQHAVPTEHGYKFVDDGGSEPALVMNIQSTDPNLSSWTDFIGFIQSLKTVFHMTTLDMMACALYSNPDWKYIIDLMAARENITIRASLDNTGTVLDEGNWILETNDIDLTDVYFTDKIYNWKYVLVTYIDNRFYALRWNNAMYATRSYDARLKIAAGTNNFTIETWYYETTAQQNATIVDMGNYNYTFHVRTNGTSGLAFYNRALADWLYATSATITTGQWNHLAITRSGSTFTFYINGVARQTLTNSTSFSSDNSTFAIGLQAPGACNCNYQKTDSALYDLRLWNVARTASEIQMNRNRIIPANTTGLVANYLLTDNGGVFNDRTANGLHTTIQSYSAARWSNSTVPIPNIGFLIDNGYSLRTGPTGGSLTAITTFDDITYTDFSGVDLSGVNFANADLTGSNFTNANLTNANLTYAVIVGATFTGAITTGSSISLAITSPTNVLRFDSGVNSAVFISTPPTWSYGASPPAQFRATMTIECWFKTSDTAAQKAYATLVSRNASATDGSPASQFTIYMASTGEIWFGITNTGSTASSYHATTGQYKDANWHHVACSYDSTTGLKRIYIDGVISRTDAVPSGFGLLANDTTTQLVFGSDLRGVNFFNATRQFRGFMSDIRIWNVVRSAADISNNMRQRLVGNESGLVGYWKLHQGYGTGWTTSTSVQDSTSNRVHGGTTGAPVSFYWVVSNGGLFFQPRISAITLGPNNGTYALSDTSFSFIDPSSNSLGDFTYAVSPGTVATVTNGASTRKTVYATSGAIAIPTLSTFEFPELASLTDWQIDISFTVSSFTQTSGASSWRALVGDMYNEINTSRGWGLWISPSNRIHWSWVISVAEPTTISVSLNTPYVLTATQSGGTITLTLRTVSTGVTQTGSFSVGSNIMGRGPVTIGGWRNLATENFPGTISYVNVSVPTNERIVTLLSVTGETPATLTATQGGLVGMFTGTKSVNLTVSATAPTISPWTIADVSFGVTPFTLTPPSTDSSGGFSYTSLNTAVATVSGSTVTVLKAGTATIRAIQDACGNYTTGSVDASFAVSPIAPTIGTWTIADVSFGVTPFTLTPPSTDSSGGFSYTSLNTAVATVSGSTVTVLKAGTATIRAIQDACGNYTTGSVDASFAVSPIAPTIGTWTIAGVSFGVTPFTLTPPSTDSSGGFSYTSLNTSVATVSGNTVTVVAAGTASIRAIQDACGNYTTGSVDASFAVSPIAPTIGTWTIAGVSFGVTPFTLTPPSTDSSGGFSYTSLNTAVATVSGNTVTVVAAGTASIRATQDACGNYTSGSVDASLVISPALSNFTVGPKIYGDDPFDLTNPTSFYTNEPFLFTIVGDTTVAALSGTNGRTVTILKAGETSIKATQVATQEHPELNITATLVVAKRRPIITINSITKTYGDASFNLVPSSTNTDNSGLGGVFTFTSSEPSVASIFDTSYVSITGIGGTTITITQAATTNFTDASNTVVLTVNKATPVLTALTVSSNRTYGSAPFSALTLPTSISNGVITYSTTDNNVATIDNSGVITLVGAGYVTFIATQASTAFYNQVTKASNTMTVHRQILLLQRSSPTDAVINKTYGDSYFTVSATNASNGGAITYETNNPSVAGIINASMGVISVISVGTATITARRAQTAQYTSTPISWTVEVARATATLSGLADLSYNVTAAPFTVYASSVSDGPVTYSLQNPLSNVLTIDTSNGYGLVTLRTPGTAVIVASQAPGTLYQTPSSITATITVTSAGNVLQGATITNATSFATVNLSGANLTNAVITSTNFAGADLSGAIFSGATITGATFTSVSLTSANLSGATLTSSVFTGADLSGARLTGVNASGSSFENARLNNVDLTGANIESVNFTNTSIKGANITDVSFSPLQKLQLLKNSENRDIGQIIIPEVTGTTILAAISATSPLRAIPNLDLTSASVTVAVVIPQTSTSPTDILPDVSLNVQDNDKFYLPINTGEYFQIDGVKYYTSNGVVRNYSTNAVVEVITYDGKQVWLLAGSIVGLVLQANTMSASSFVVPSLILYTNTTPFMPTTLPTSNSDSPIIYSSSNTNIATIDPSSGLITPTGNRGLVRFTATQVQNATYAPGSITSNLMLIDKNISFSLIGLNQSFSLSTLATLDASSINPDTTDATAVFYLRVSDMINVFKYQTDAHDVNNTDASDVKYYVFHRKWPAELKINPSHAMMNKAESRGMLGGGQGFASDKSLMKHDFIRYIALRLFNTIHGVDLFHNEADLRENITYFGETVRYNIESILSGISTTSASETMSYDASGNKYLTNDSSGNTNLCRELMRQVAAAAPERFYNNGGDNDGLRNFPFVENDTILFKVIVQAAPTQNALTGVSEIPSRSYTIKLVLKNTVTSSDNTAITDSEMYPNTRPYSSSVTTYAATADSSGVYNIYSPPAPIPFSRFGYNGWYYKNSSAWVNVNPTVRTHIKWLVAANTAGVSTVADLRYIRLNIKIYNNASLPYLMIYTQAGSSRKYAVIGGNGSLTNGTMYSMFINFNSYLDEPAMVGYTNAELVNTIGSGSFANNEIIASIAIETESNAAAGNVEFTLASMIIGELSTTTGLTTEKEYGFEADVPVAYP